MEYRYIKNGILKPCIFKAERTNVGVSKEDYQHGKWIPVSEQQAVFYAANKYASYEEIMNMQMVVVEIQQPTNQELYEQELVSLIRERYSLDDELRILYNGSGNAEFIEHETFVSGLKINLKIKYNIQ